MDTRISNNQMIRQENAYFRFGLQMGIADRIHGKGKPGYLDENFDSAELQSLGINPRVLLDRNINPFGKSSLNYMEVAYLMRKMDPNNHIQGQIGDMTDSRMIQKIENGYFAATNAIKRNSNISNDAILHFKDTEK